MALAGCSPCPGCCLCHLDSEAGERIVFHSFCLFDHSYQQKHLGCEKNHLKHLRIHLSQPAIRGGRASLPCLSSDGGQGGGAPSCPIPRGSYASFTSLFLYFPLQPQPHKSQPARKLPPKKDMKEQEKEGSDSKESPKTKSDESGEEKNGDEDCQRGGQKKKGE